jgi:predicted esterase
VTPTRIFIHGLQGSAQGTKARFFRSRYPEMMIPDFRGDLDQRMVRLENVLTGHRSIICVGSSYGGVMALLFAQKHPHWVRKLILLAPALSWYKFSLRPTGKLSLPVIIYHGYNDEVVPWMPVHRRAHDVLKNLAFHLLADDHCLSNSFSRLDWPHLLETTL